MNHRSDKASMTSSSDDNLPLSKLTKDQFTLRASIMAYKALKALLHELL